MVKRSRKAKVLVFFRLYRHEPFDTAFPHELASQYQQGHPTVAPALLALALILEASTGVWDDEVSEATVMDRRGPLVLDGVDAEEVPFCKGTRVAFRQRRMEGQRDRWLIERTIESAHHSQACGARAMACGTGEQPLVGRGAGRVEETSNLVGYARNKVRRVVADRAWVGAGRGSQGSEQTGSARRA